MSGKFTQKVKNGIKRINRVVFGHQDPRVVARKKYFLAQTKWQTKKYNTHQLLDFIEGLGVTSGSTVMMQTSWSQFYNYQGKPTELFNGIIEILGIEGTLCMPCNSDYDPSKPFDVHKTPSNAGLLSEAFRRKKGVKRSIHYNSSVSAYGAKAEELTCEHKFSVTSWDEYSPYYKLHQMNAINLTLGLGKPFKYVTAFHCVDSMLREEVSLYFKLFSEPSEIEYFDENGELQKHKIIKRERGRLNFWRINRHLRDVPHQSGKISNLEGYTVPLKALVERAVDLGRQGITIYYPPYPNKRELLPPKQKQQRGQVD